MMYLEDGEYSVQEIFTAENVNKKWRRRTRS